MTVLSLVQPDLKRAMESVTRFIETKPTVGSIPFLFSDVYGGDGWVAKMTDVLISYDALDVIYLDRPLMLEDIDIKQQGKFIQLSVCFNEHLYFLVSDVIPEFDTLLPNVTKNPYVKASMRTHRTGNDGYLSSSGIEPEVVLNLIAKDLFLVNGVWEESEEGLFIIHEEECLKATKKGENYFDIETSNGEWLTYILVKHLHAMNPTVSKTLLDIEALHRLNIMPAHMGIYGSKKEFSAQVKTFTVSKEEYPELVSYLRRKVTCLQN